MKRSLILLAMTVSLTACSSQQVQQAAGYAAGTAMVGAGLALVGYKIKNDLEDDCDARCQADKKRSEQLREAREASRTARRIEELSASLDGYLTAEPDIEMEQRSIVLVPDDLPVPQRSVDRLNAVLSEEVPED